MNCVRLLCETADIIALQETWLLPYELSCLENKYPALSYTEKSSVDTSKGILTGRPYAGVAILCRKSIFQSVSIVQSENNRFSAISVLMNNKVFHGYKRVYANRQCWKPSVIWIECLGEMYAMMENSGMESIFVLGDFNAGWLDHCIATLGKP